MSEDVQVRCTLWLTSALNNPGPRNALVLRCLRCSHICPLQLHHHRLNHARQPQHHCRLTPPNEYIGALEHAWMLRWRYTRLRCMSFGQGKHRGMQNTICQSEFYLETEVGNFRLKVAVGESPSGNAFSTHLQIQEEWILQHGQKVFWSPLSSALLVV